VRLPTFSRQSDTDTDTDTTTTAERPATAPVRPRAEAATSGRPSSEATTPGRPSTEATTLTDLPPAPKHAADLPPGPKTAGRTGLPPTARPDVLATKPTSPAAPAVGPKPRASLLATLGLILGVVSALLVLSGPLLGYGLGVAGLALVLSLAGIRATGKRHVAGKSDALLGMVLSLAAIVVGVLALTGSLSWLGTDTQPVNNLREWLDTQFADRF
jgi:hypothetical protein